MKAVRAKLGPIGSFHRVQRKSLVTGRLSPKFGDDGHSVELILTSVAQMDLRAAESIAACRSSKNDKGSVKTRLEEQAEHLVAIDVEYVHLTIQESGNASNNIDIQLPAEVCLIDADGNSIFWSIIDSVSELRLTDYGMSESEFGFDIIHKGGCPLEDIKGKPLISEVRKILKKNMTGRLVVGHNLAKDLTSLGIHISIPLEMRRDTMAYPCLQNEKGHGRALSHLAETKLNRVIQSEKHDAREDALATLELYLKYCHFDENSMDYDDLVEFYLSQIRDTSDSKIDSM